MGCFIDLFVNDRLRSIGMKIANLLAAMYPHPTYIYIYGPSRVPAQLKRNYHNSQI